MFLKFRLLLLSLLIPWICHAEMPKMVTEVYPLDMTDFDAAEAMGNAIVSPEGKFFADKQRNRVVLYDTPEKQKALKEALSKINVAPQNVRIKVIFKDHNFVESSKVGANGRIQVGSVTIETPGKKNAPVQIEARQTQGTLSSLLQQELLVRSGGQAKLRVGTDVPYLEWFWGYGVQWGYWTGVPRWKEVGARMIVEPYVFQNRIRIKLTPEFSYVIDNQTMATAIEKLTTEVWVDDGAELDLGGLNTANNEFFSKFLTSYDHYGEKRSLSIVLRPTIETLQPAGLRSDEESPNTGAFRRNRD